MKRSIIAMGFVLLSIGCVLAADKPAPVSGSLRPEVRTIGTVGATVSDIGSVDHLLQVWRVLPAYARPGKYRLSAQHAASGRVGAFRMVAYADTNDDGVPDKRIGRSPELKAKKSGDWSTWEFKTTLGSLFVGTCWSESETRIYYSKRQPEGYLGLSDEVFVSRTEDDPPNGAAKPRFTNILLELVDD